MTSIQTPKVLPVMNPNPPQPSTSKRMWSGEPDATTFSDHLGSARNESDSPSWKRYDRGRGRGRGRIRRQQVELPTGYTVSIFFGTDLQFVSWSPDEITTRTLH